MSGPFRSSVSVSWTLNGTSRTESVRPSTTLVELLREELGLTGTTESCGVGVCGCCTVLVDGEPVNACLELAANVDGASVVTVEGLGRPGALDPVQAAFKREEGFQCGYCTPGMVLMTRALLAETPDPDEAEVKHYLAENLCRCTGYASILDAVGAAAEGAGAADD